MEAFFLLWIADGGKSIFTQSRHFFTGAHLFWIVLSVWYTNGENKGKMSISHYRYFNFNMQKKCSLHVWIHTKTSTDWVLADLVCKTDFCFLFCTLGQTPCAFIIMSFIIQALIQMLLRLFLITQIDNMAQMQDFRKEKNLHTNIFISWSHISLGCQSPLEFRPGGGGGHLREVWVGCATEAFKPWPCWRQNLLILLPCLRQETFTFCLCSAFFVCLVFHFPYRKYFFYEWHPGMRF